MPIDPRESKSQCSCRYEPRAPERDGAYKMTHKKKEGKERKKKQRVLVDARVDELFNARCAAGFQYSLLRREENIRQRQRR
jgi:hypothetical protein